MPADAGAVAELQTEEVSRMTRRDAARYLGNAEKTLAMWELQGKGPPSVKVGGRRFYFNDDLDAFVQGGVRHR
jgi:hypothetical protein